MGYLDPEAQRKYQREWRALRRAEWFNGKKCVECGSTQNLELDHIDPSKKVTHNVWSWSKKRRDAELGKCQALCDVCHQKKTIETREVRTDHGRGQMYQNYGCRCVKCRAWKSASDKLYR
jgi:5-methylcytosine-specific restriction endonuclease McrA